MAVHKKLLDTNNELILHRFGNGVKLIKPVERSNPPCSILNAEPTVEDILKTDFHSYFLNIEGAVQNMNEAGASAFGIDSIKSFLGKEILKLIPHDYAAQIKKNDRQVMTTNKTLIFEEEFMFKENIFNALTIKFPWYGEDNKIIGLFGCTIEIGKQPLVNALTKVMQMGLLIPATHLFAPKKYWSGQKINNVHLSKRQAEILRFVVRGKSLKEISQLLNLSKRTVEHYFEDIKNKMLVFSKAELIEKVIDFFI